MKELQFTGDENMSRVLDQLFAHQESIYGKVVTVSTKGGTFRGKIISKGGQFLMLEQDTQVNSMSRDQTQRIFSQQLISIAAITGLYFEVLRNQS